MQSRIISVDDDLPEDADQKLWQFLRYWRSKCDAGRLPARRDIDPTEIAALLAAIFLIEVDGQDFRFRLVGQDVMARYGSLKGRTLRELMAGRELERTIAEHRRAVTARQPVYSENTIQSAGTGDWQLYQRLLAPLAGADGVVDGLAGIMVFRRTCRP